MILIAKTYDKIGNMKKEIDFRKTVFWGVAASVKSCPEPDRPEVVLSGKSNVGKSSLLNVLVDNRKMARVSSAPGKTRLVVYFDVDGAFYLADLPGYGFAKAPKEEIAKFSALTDSYFASGRPICLIVHLLDVRHPPTKEDEMMIRYLRDKGLPFLIVFTKLDKLSRSQALTQMRSTMKGLAMADVPYYGVSALKKTGLQELRDAISDYVMSE